VSATRPDAQGLLARSKRGYSLEHAHNKNPSASRVLHSLLRVVHMFAQLTEKPNLYRNPFRAAAGSAKKIAFRVLSTWGNFRVSTQRIE